jgi:RNA polymerase sigma-70 factor (ECF subfamily)
VAARRRENRAATGLVANAGDTPQASEEAALVIRVRSGDSAAFAGLIERHQRTAFAIAFHVLQHREDAEDAVQQAFLAALARIDTFDVSRPFGPWLARVVLNHSRTARRARTRIAKRQVPLEVTEPVTSLSGAPDRLAEDAEIRERVRAAVALLPERQRLAVQLIDVEGRSPSEVAAILEVSPVTARWHLMAGRRKLRRLLAPLIRGGDDDAASDDRAPFSPRTGAPRAPDERERERVER